MVDEFLHEWEDVSIVGGGSQNDFAVTESIFHSFCHVAASKVIDSNFAASCFQFFCQQLYRFFGVAVYRSVSNDNAFFFRLIGRPGVVEIEIVAQIFGENRAVEWADSLDIQSSCFFQQSLYLCAVFANDTDVVASCFASPVFFHIQCAEFAETVCGEENFVHIIVSNDNFRPVNHRSGHEGQGVLTERKGAAFAYNDLSVCKVGAEEVLHHLECFGGRNDFCFRIGIGKGDDVGRMVRFHVLNHQIVRFTAFQSVFDVVQPLLTEVSIHAVHDGDFLINDGIGVVSHAVWYDVLTFKQVDLVVVDTNVFNIFCNVHVVPSVS